MLGGNERRSKGDELGKRSFPSKARSAEKKKRQGMKLSTTWLVQCGLYMTGFAHQKNYAN